MRLVFVKSVQERTWFQGDVMYEKMIMTVGQLNLFIKDLLGQVPLLSNIKIKGEISNFKSHSSGHLYMSLKDETGTLRAVMFKNAAFGLDFQSVLCRHFMNTSLG